MRHKAILRFGLVLFAVLSLVALASGRAQKSGGAAQPAILKTWNDEAMAALEVPLADPRGSPKHVSAEYYYKIPVLPIYKQYPVYAPGHEPPVGDHAKVKIFEPAPRQPRSLWAFLGWVSY